ncbi:MAG TPA: c-type cytochrome biogenesis protein CcmI [Gammaproteobacteria bacterium]|nr:c-type cytochrome biogenesis protein CcmI [Gammaproteobacteria bacterium]
MMVFWLVAVLLIAAALLFLLPPLIQKIKRDTDEDTFDRDELNVTIFKDQLAELERDLAAGVLTQEQFDAAKHDLERSFLQDANTEDGESVAQTDHIIGRSAAVVIAVVIPILAVSLYNLLGSGEAGLHPEDARPQVQAEGHDGTLEEQVRKLQDHLQQNPDDVEGWVMLARSYYFLKQYGAAAETFARASSMVQDSNPELLADYADALAMANGRNMAGKPFELVKKALQIQPRFQKALWLAGTATYQAGDYEATLDYWKRLLAIFPKGSDNYLQMQKNIAEIQQKLGLPIDAEIQAAAAAANGPRITGVVRLDESLMLDAAVGDTLFVYARAAKGPRMPLAIVRKTVKDLPLEFTLDDSMAMNPAMKLSNFQQVVVGARISKSGNAMPQPGDMQAVSAPVNVAEAPHVELVIKQVIQ